MPVEVTEDLEVLVDRASDLAKLEPRQTVNLKTFIVSGFDVKSVGMFVVPLLCSSVSFCTILVEISM